MCRLAKVGLCHWPSANGPPVEGEAASLQGESAAVERAELGITVALERERTGPSR